ncbi:hypothetical protein SAMN04488117_11323 [Celeribacter baekdonensis]|uniref:Uncharacterized protein n=1 Tax=Celeribacter baekdonensis TaxID=875171 RepID=A0A1G7RZP9_9RHOB|nr:hypothetical protein SAMN04488117_11323 [Celeribacter baekdonensis]
MTNSLTNEFNSETESHNQNRRGQSSEFGNTGVSGAYSTLYSNDQTETNVTVHFPRALGDGLDWAAEQAGNPGGGYNHPNLTEEDVNALGAGLKFLGIGSSITLTESVENGWVVNFDGSLVAGWSGTFKISGWNPLDWTLLEHKTYANIATFPTTFSPPVALWEALSGSKDATARPRAGLENSKLNLMKLRSARDRADHSIFGTSHLRRCAAGTVWNVTRTWPKRVRKLSQISERPQTILTQTSSISGPNLNVVNLRCYAILASPQRFGINLSTASDFVGPPLSSGGVRGGPNDHARISAILRLRVARNPRNSVPST